MKVSKKNIKVTIIIIVGLAIAWYGLSIYTQQSNPKETEKFWYLSQIPITTYQYETDFKEIHQIVLDNYSLYKSKQLNMDSIYQACIARISQAKTPTDYGLIVQEYISALKCTHAFSFFQMYTANARPAFIQDSLFIDKPNEYLIQYGFKDKDKIIAINELPIQEWINKNKKYTEASTPAYQRLRTALDAFHSFTDTLCTYTLLRNKDTLTLSLPLKHEEYFPYKETKTVETKILHDSIGYLAINTMMSPVTTDFLEAYPKVQQLPYLILDIRQNGGGNSDNGKFICQHFIKQEQPHCLSSDILMKPASNSYKGKIYLLTGTYTCSAAESFAIDMKESNNVILVGETTCGDTGNSPRTFHTKHQIYFMIPTSAPDMSPKGFPLEGVGISPHYNISQTTVDFMNNQDTQLNYILKLIQVSHVHEERCK